MKNKILLKAHLRFIVLFLLILSPAIYAVKIEKIAKIQPAGLITLKATFTDPNSTVKWEASSYTLDESTGARAVQGVVSIPYRDSMRVLLVKPTGKYTFYKVIVSENNFKDSVEIQVFNKGNAEKYLFNNPNDPAKPIPVYIILPSKYSAGSKFIMSMHGTNRDAINYASSWKSFSTSNNYIIAAPEFSSSNWSSQAYILGNMFTGTNGTGSLNPQNRWSFYLVQLIHKELTKAFGINDSTYTIWGHSAGAQFVHRMALFCPDNLVAKYISANAGWYTVPDRTVIYPWGVMNSILNLTNEYLFNFTKVNFVLMRGTADTLRDSELNTEPLSEVQGRNRYERAAYYYNKVREINPALAWAFIDVPNVGHESDKMAAAAGNYLLGSNTSVHQKDNSVPEVSEIINYPNPFNSTTQIVFTIAKASQVEIVVYNLLGEKILILSNEYLNPGKYIRNLNAENLSSGIYFCTLKSGSSLKTTKLLLLK